MCLTCGCMLPHEDHGEADHLLIEHLEKSAKLDGVSLDEAVDRLVKTVQVAKDETEHDHR
jgi:DNA-directed RNA polymerase subunit F